MFFSIPKWKNSTNRNKNYCLIQFGNDPIICMTADLNEKFSIAELHKKTKELVYYIVLHESYWQFL